jgi:hypothetical protein
MELTKDQIESLAGFALDMLDEWPELGSIDGWDLQDIAEKHKLLIPRTVTEPCGEDCNCSECYTEEEMQRGVNCYHIADWLARDAQQRNAPDLPEQKCSACKGSGEAGNLTGLQKCYACDGTGISKRSGGG